VTTPLSVVIPTLNRSDLLLQALDSLLMQTCQPSEIIVVDDASTEDIHAALSRAGRRDRVQLIRLPSRQGAAVARNTGVAASSAEIVCFLDSDDWLAPTHHETVSPLMLHLDLLAVESSVVNSVGTPLYSEGYVARNSRLKRLPIPQPERSVEDIFLFGTPLPGLCVRKEVFVRVGGMVQDLFPVEDYDFQIRVAGAGFRVGFLALPLATYRMHEDNSSGPARAVRLTRQKLRCLESASCTIPRLSGQHRLVARRLAEARLELGLALLKARSALGLPTILRALCEDPTRVAELFVIAGRKLRRKSG
jgi:GT2 family glycosyltransferase